MASSPSPSSIDAALNRQAKDANGEIMLHFASRKGCLVSCRFLLEEARLDVNSVSKTGVTPMFLAGPQVMWYLLDHGGDPAMPDERGSTQLHNAGVAGHCEAVRLLLFKGAHMDPTDYQGTPLHLSAVKDQDQIVTILLEHGAAANKVACRVFSSLMMTVCGKSLKCMKLLIEHVAIPTVLAAASGRHKLVQILFTGTKPTPSLHDLSVVGIIKTLNSPKISPPSGLDVSRAAAQTMKAITELLRVFTMYPLLVFLLVILLLSTRVCSVTHDTSSNEGTCRYDMISVAVLSCMQPDNSWRSPSVSCCKALIHAIDELPASGENGKCCLCRFMRAKLCSPELAATYISCHGKDRDIVATWSFPVTVCGKACSQKVIAPPRKETVMERPLSHSHVSKILFILFAVFFIILLIFILYLWWVSRAASGRRESLPLKQTRRTSLGSGRRQSSGRFKERRASG